MLRNVNASAVAALLLFTPGCLGTEDDQGEVGKVSEALTTTLHATLWQDGDYRQNGVSASLGYYYVGDESDRLEAVLTFLGTPERGPTTFTNIKIRIVCDLGRYQVQPTFSYEDSTVMPNGALFFYAPCGAGNPVEADASFDY